MMMLLLLLGCRSPPIKGKKLQDLLSYGTKSSQVSERKILLMTGR